MKTHYSDKITDMRHSNPWHSRQTCPRCHSGNLVVTAEHSSHGYNGYHCNNCGCNFG